MAEDKIRWRTQTQPSEKYGKSPEERSLKELKEFGLVIIDKPAGPTSHQVSAYTQKILEEDKAGHGGTLDPKVTGVLTIATGKAARLLEYQLKAGKTYVCIMHLHDDIEEHKIRQVMEEFIGQITQLPPKRSAVARRKRQRNIYTCEIIEIDGRDVLFKTDVQAGTYLRKLCHDIGERIGCGAHMAELRRTRAAYFHEDQAVTLQTLSDAYAEAKKGNEKAFREIVKPAEELATKMPKIIILDSAVHSLTQGAMLKVPGIAGVEKNIKPGEMVRVVTLKDELVLVGTSRMSSNQMISSQRGIAVKPDKVFMSPETYPRME